MSDDVMVREEETAFLASRQKVLLWPAVLATVVGGALLALWLLQGVLAAVILHQHPQWAAPEGAVLIEPSRSDRIGSWARFLAPLALGVALLLATWRFRGRGQRVATCVCALATIVTGLFCWISSAV